MSSLPRFQGGDGLSVNGAQRQESWGCKQDDGEEAVDGITAHFIGVAD